MAVHYRTKGFILKKENLREADQIFTIYTQDFGKLEILGKAIRKIKSKLRSGAEIFYLSEIEFIQGKTYKTLTDAILIEKFENLRLQPTHLVRGAQTRVWEGGGRVGVPPSVGPLEKLRIAYQIADVFDGLVKGQEKDENIWQLLNETFHKLNTLSLVASHLSLVYYYFLWNLFSILGYQPELYNCSLCQKNLFPEKLHFSSKEGGVICPNCFKKVKKIKKIDIDIIKIIRLFLEKNWSILNRLKIKEIHLNLLKNISIDYLNQIFEKSK